MQRTRSDRKEWTALFQRDKTSKNQRKKSGFNEELFEVFQVELALIEGLTKNHGKYSHFIQALDVVRIPYTSAGEYLQIGKSIQDVLIKIEIRSLHCPIPGDIRTLSILKTSLVEELKVVVQVKFRLL